VQSVHELTAVLLPVLFNQLLSLSRRYVNLLKQMIEVIRLIHEKEANYCKVEPEATKSDLMGPVTSNGDFTATFGDFKFA